MKSHHVGLVQIADLYAAIWLFRRYAELTDHSDAERYPGETRHIVEWVELLAPRLVAKGSRWPVRSPSPSAAVVRQRGSGIASGAEVRVDIVRYT